MFERFTKNARLAVVAAQSEARTLEHDRISDAHVLLGVLATPSVGERILTGNGADLGAARELVARQEGRAGDPEALKSLGIDLEEVRRRAEETFGPGALERPARRRRIFGRLLPSHIPFQPSGKQVLEDSLKTALSLRHNYIGTEHLVLAILGRADSRAAGVLRATGVTLDQETATALVLAEIRRSA